MNIIEKDLSYNVVGVAMKVHRELGPGLDEFYYNRAMLERFRAANVRAIYKAKGKLIYKGHLADRFEADVLVEDSIILELKHLDGAFCPHHYTQLVSYLKHWDIRLGMLIDFGKERLIFERIVYDSPQVSVDRKQLFEQQPSEPRDRELLTTIYNSLVSICNQHGFGYRAKTYRALTRIDFGSLGLKIRVPTATICIDDQPLGNGELNCFVVNDACAVRVLALREKLRAADRAIVQTYLKHLNLHWGLIVNFGKKNFEAKLVWQS